MCPRCTHLPPRPSIMQAVLQQPTPQFNKPASHSFSLGRGLSWHASSQPSVGYKLNAAICGKRSVSRCRVVRERERERHRSAAGCKLSIPIMWALSAAGADHTHTAPCTKPHRAMCCRPTQRHSCGNVIMPHNGPTATTNQDCKMTK